MTDRYQQFLSALGSMRLAGAEPSPRAIALGMRWGRGEITTAELEAATDRIAATAAKQAAAGLPVTGWASGDEPQRPRPTDV